MALAQCILGKFCGVVCHCFLPPLDVPTFAARCLYVPNDARMTIKIINTICRTCSSILNRRQSLRLLSLFQSLSGHGSAELQARCLEFGAAASAWPEGDCINIQAATKREEGVVIVDVWIISLLLVTITFPPRPCYPANLHATLLQ